MADKVTTELLAVGAYKPVQCIVFRSKVRAEIGESVAIATRLPAGRPGFDYRLCRIVVVPTTYRRALGLTHPPI